MALDESRADDEVFTDRDVTYVVQKTLFHQVKPIKIDFVTHYGGSGFTLASNLDATGGCGPSCSTC